VDLFSLGPLVQKTRKTKVTLLTKYDDLFGVTFCLLGIFFCADMLLLFWCKGPIIKPATEFFTHYCFRSWHFVMGNNIIRAEGKAKFAMVAMIIPILSTLY
jgi:Na+-driven multidrug efflux pump